MEMKLEKASTVENWIVCLDCNNLVLAPKCIRGVFSTLAEFANSRSN